MFNHGRHRAPKQCADHLGELIRTKRDLQWFKEQCAKLNRETDHLRAQLTMLQRELGTEAPTRPVPVEQLRAQLRARAPETIKVRTETGFMMLLPVGTNRARRVRPVPSWAVRD